MIWFYGGGFMVGGSMGPIFLNNYYSGQEIADQGNVIVVSVGYRLGNLGFLSTGDSGLPGEVKSCTFTSYIYIYFLCAYCVSPYIELLGEKHF